MKKKFLCVALSAMMLLPAVPIHAKQNTTINKTFITLPKKNSYTLKIKGTKKKVKWSSSKKKVVAVTKSGKVIAKKSGTTVGIGPDLIKNLELLILLQKLMVKH